MCISYFMHTADASKHCRQNMQLYQTLPLITFKTPTLQWLWAGSNKSIANYLTLRMLSKWGHIRTLVTGFLSFLLIKKEMQFDRFITELVSARRLRGTLLQVPPCIHAGCCSWCIMPAPVCSVFKCRSCLSVLSAQLAFKFRPQFTESAVLTLSLSLTYYCDLEKRHARRNKESHKVRKSLINVCFAFLCHLLFW